MKNKRGNLRFFWKNIWGCFGGFLGFFGVFFFLEKSVVLLYLISLYSFVYINKYSFCGRCNINQWQIYIRRVKIIITNKFWIILDYYCLLTMTLNSLDFSPFNFKLSLQRTVLYFKDKWFQIAFFGTLLILMRSFNMCYFIAAYLLVAEFLAQSDYNLG